jgi:hypothetical protein
MPVQRELQLQVLVPVHVQRGELRTLPVALAFALLELMSKGPWHKDSVKMPLFLAFVQIDTVCGVFTTAVEIVDISVSV